MIQVVILEAKDIIQKDDFVRQLSLTYVGQSDTLLTNSIYGNSRINRLGWIKAEEFCPGWVGETVGDFLETLADRQHKSNRHAIEVCSFEFIRGAIPKSHTEDFQENRRF